MCKRQSNDDNSIDETSTMELNLWQFSVKVIELLVKDAWIFSNWSENIYF